MIIITVLVPLTLVLAVEPPAPDTTPVNPHFKDWNSIDCPPLTVIHGQAVLTDYLEHQQVITITCKGNYKLVGEGVLIGTCSNQKWLFEGFSGWPQCVLRCPPPPYLENGELSIEKVPKDHNQEMGYLEGTRVTYTCSNGYMITNPVRECQNGTWSGANAFCKPTNEVMCPDPPNIPYGFIEGSLDYFWNGDEVMYHCDYGYKMEGRNVLKCTVDGTWSNEEPHCIPETDSLAASSCAEEPKLPDKMVVASVTGDVADVDCHPPYRNELSPCRPVKFRCQNGRWEGVYPKCAMAYACTEPASVHYSQAMNRNFEVSYDTKGRAYYPFDAQISYECLKGYNLVGSAIITCQTSTGCWQPRNLWPKCVRTNQEADYFAELNNINAIFISTATGAGVLGVLLLACLMVACKKRRALSRAAPLPPPTVNDHTILLQNPDRLALIAFADGVQNHQNTLPSYDEATRDRSTVIQVSRLQIQRPHWPNLTVCRTNRSRASPQIDHVPRHGSFGSTDTVTISEGSTNVTLDTASSHSAASHSASCRGHCGSLTSFDACSMINNEGIPLLEENEEAAPVNNCH